MAYQQLSFSRERLPELTSLLSANAAARWPAMTPLLPGDLVWQLPGSGAENNLRLWYRQQQLVGYAWFQPPGTLQYDIRVDTDDPETVTLEMLAWAGNRRLEFEPGYPFYLDLKSMAEWAQAITGGPQAPADPRHYLVTSALETNTSASALLTAQGFNASQHFEPHLAMSLDRLPDPPTLPDITVRAVKETEFDQRIEVHRAAWAPSTGFTRERYLQVRDYREVFDPELDLVAVDGRGHFLSSCICWADPESGIGFFEPFGTRPEARGSGVSQMLITAGLRRLQQKGMKYARIYTAGFNQPARRLYESCGFRLQDINRTYLKVITEA